MVDHRGTKKEEENQTMRHNYSQKMTYYVGPVSGFCLVMAHLKDKVSTTSING